MKNKDLFIVDIAQAQKFDKLPSVLLDQLKTGKDALSMSVSMSGATHESLANDIGKPRETLTRFINGNGGLNLRHIKKLINATGNIVILQYLAKTFGYELTPIDTKAKRLAELQAEMDALVAEEAA